MTTPASVARLGVGFGAFAIATLGLSFESEAATGGTQCAHASQSIVTDARAYVMAVQCAESDITQPNDAAFSVAVVAVAESTDAAHAVAAVETSSRHAAAIEIEER